MEKKVSLQDIFNIVWEGVEGGMMPSIKNGTECLYVNVDTPRNNKDGECDGCFIGYALMKLGVPKDLLLEVDKKGTLSAESLLFSEPPQEGHRFHHVLKNIRESLPRIQYLKNPLNELQGIHDLNHQSMWKTKLREYANKHNLIIPESPMDAKGTE